MKKTKVEIIKAICFDSESFHPAGERLPGGGRAPKYVEMPDEWAAHAIALGAAKPAPKSTPAPADTEKPTGKKEGK